MTHAVKTCLLFMCLLALNIKPHSATEMHLFPHVQFPGYVGISVIFIAGPAVELGLNDLLLNW